MLFIEVYFTQKFLPNVYIIFVFLCDNKRKPCAVHVGSTIVTQAARSRVLALDSMVQSRSD